MIILLAGTTHTGKTLLAQELMGKYSCPYLSLDHLKMGLIRSGQTTLTPEDDDLLTDYLWPIAREIIKTAIENKQSLIIEGCYIPFNWQKDFTQEYKVYIKYRCLIMSEQYVLNNFDSIKAHAGAIEVRLEDGFLSAQKLAADNAFNMTQCEEHGLQYILIKDKYNINDMVQLV